MEETFQMLGCRELFWEVKLYIVDFCGLKYYILFAFIFQTIEKKTEQTAGVYEL